MLRKVVWIRKTSKTTFSQGTKSVGNASISDVFDGSGIQVKQGVIVIIEGGNGNCNAR